MASILDAKDLARQTEVSVAELTTKVQQRLIEETVEVQVPGPGAVQVGGDFFERRPARPLKLNLDLLNHFARRARLDGNETRAREYWVRAIESDPRDGRAWLALARGEAKRRNFEQAVGLFKRGLKYSPENVHLLQAYGVCLEKAGRPMLAMKLYKHACELDATHAPSWVARAQIELGRRDFAAARACYEAGAKGDASNHYVWQAWAVMEAGLGDSDEARRLFARAEAANGRNAATFQAWAVMEARLDNF